MLHKDCLPHDNSSLHRRSLLQDIVKQVATTRVQGEPEMLVSKMKRPRVNAGGLPDGWRNVLSINDQTWIEKKLFPDKKLTVGQQLWYHPPEPGIALHGQPTPDAYFLHSLLIWMPRRQWKWDFRCPFCNQSLTSAGLYPKIRQVLDLKQDYYIATEYLACANKQCGKKVIGWDDRLLNQLPEGLRARFPAVLTWQKACDQAIVSLMRSRTLGNSSSALRSRINELHSDDFLRRQLMYLGDCERHKRGRITLSQEIPEYLPAPLFVPVPSAKWLLSVYVQDVYRRMNVIKASLSSVFGQILKIDGTKKICTKLQGYAANTAAWATSVSNEFGQVLITVFTVSEEFTSLDAMAKGLIRRYSRAGKKPPVVLYVDRDCCASSGPSRFQKLFSEWSNLTVKLDSWHFMRRFACACTSESHPLFGTFMSRLSGCMFEWDAEDLARLRSAKKEELRNAGNENPTSETIDRAIKKEELQLHCKRRTFLPLIMCRKIESLILSLTGCTDALGVPLFKPSMAQVWQEERRHVSCLQDLPDLQLYTEIGSVMKGGILVPLYRCARGTTSLESFHLHLARFVPGTSASPVNMQAYLLDGSMRWNEARASAAITMLDNLSSFDHRLKELVNSKGQSVLGRSLVTVALPIEEYNGELFGIDYLFSQTGSLLPDTQSAQFEEQVDQAFAEDQILEETVMETADNTDIGICDAFVAEPDIVDDDIDSSDGDVVSLLSDVCYFLFIINLQHFKVTLDTVTASTTL